MNNTHLAAGSDGIVKMIQNGTGIIQTIGASLVILVFVVIAVMMLFGSFGQNSSMRQHIGKIIVAAVACLLMGSAAIIGPMLTSTGGDLTKGTGTGTSNTGVN